jgi:hypothetical protein
MIVKISTSKIKDYLKKIIPECSKWSIGQIDENQEKMIALYANRRQLEDNSKYKKLKTYGIIPITLLLRWTKNYNTAETMANKIYELLDCSSFFIDDYNCSIECLYNGPIDLGADENNIYEFSIEINLLYRKGEK